MNSAGESVKSVEVKATPMTVPTPPKNVRVWKGDRQIVLTWYSPISDSGSSILYYKIYVLMDGEESHIGTTHKCTYTVRVVGNEFLRNGETYYFKVSAVNSVGESFLTDTVTGMPQSTPTAPAKVYTTVDDSTVTITWDEPFSTGGLPILEYRIYRKINSEYLLVAIVGSDIHTYTDMGLTNDEKYYYRITAVNYLGESKPADITGTPTDCTMGTRMGKCIGKRWSNDFNMGATCI